MSEAWQWVLLGAAGAVLAALVLAVLVDRDMRREVATATVAVLLLPLALLGAPLVVLGRFLKTRTVSAMAVDSWLKEPAQKARIVVVGSYVYLRVYRWADGERRPWWTRLRGRP